MSRIIVNQIQRNGGAVLNLPAADGAAGAVLTTNGAGTLVFGAVLTSPVGQAFYGFGNGAYTWTCPIGVTSVSVVCIGGGSASLGSAWSNQAGGGGGLGWRNNILVTPGQIYNVQVGHGGNGANGSPGGSDSWFLNTATVRGVAGSSTTGGGFVGEGGGNGGNGSQYGGGGAGGYTGNGGGQDSAGNGGGGAGGGSYSSTHGGASGGGVGPFGQGVSGAARASGNPGLGGSGGEDGTMGENPWFTVGTVGSRTGGLYGAGGAGTGTNTSQGGSGINKGGRGCVRIIWGAGRSFPSTGTGDM